VRKRQAKAANAASGLTQKQAAAVLDLSTRQVLRHAELGMPTINANGRRLYDRDAITVWYIRYLRELAQARHTATDENLAESERRKAAAEAALAEIKLEKTRGTLIPTAWHLGRIEKILTLLRASLLSMPGKYAIQIIGIRSVPEGQTKLHDMICEIMQALSDVHDDPSLDEDVPEASAVE
jgi:phage terminase Nu1 subunit (DNA packaging protein)